jgi:hypothetical protein
LVHLDKRLPAAAQGMYVEPGFKPIKTDPYQDFSRDLVDETWERKL